MGPWYHLTVGEGLGEPGAPPPIDVLALAWFDRWVKGERNRIDEDGPVTVQQLGTKRWETYPDYPRRDVRYRRFYLDGDKHAATTSPADGSLLNDGSLSSFPPEKASSDAMPGNTAVGLCSRSSTQWSTSFVPPGQPCETDNRGGHVGDVHDRATAPGAAPVWAAVADAERLDHGARRDLDRDGHRRGARREVEPDHGGLADPVAPGARPVADDLHAGRRSDRAVPPFTEESVLPVKPGAKGELAIEILNTDAILRTGHRLRVTVSSGDVSHSLAPPELTLNAGVAVAKVHRGGASPSFLTASVAPLRRERTSRHRATSRRRETSFESGPATQ